MSFFGSTDFSVQVAAGRVTGYSPVGIVGTNPEVGEIFEDIWDAGGLQTLPTAAETWEILSDNVNDALGGSGAEKVVVVSLTDAYVLQLEEVEMNGTTPVVLVNSHFRSRIMVVTQVGTVEGQNDGIITVRVSGGGATRLEMRPSFAASYSSFYTVPAGAIAIPLSLQIFIPKNEDVSVKTAVKAEGTNTPFVNGGAVDIYQNPFDFPINAKVPIGEKTDIKIQAKSTNARVEVTSILQVFEDTTTGGIVPANFSMDSRSYF